MTRIGVIGSGSWGCALAYKLCQTNQQVVLWGRNQQVIKALRERQLPLLKSYPSNLVATNDWNQITKGLDGLLICVSSTGFFDIIERLKERPVSQHIAWATKGFYQAEKESQSLCFFSDLIHTELGVSATFLTGPSFAHEVIQNKPTALVVAGQQKQALFWSNCLHSETFRTYLNSNLITAQLGAAIKNIIAISVGVCDALELGSNARAALITRGLKEMEKIVNLYQGDRETLYGLSGLGDVLLTSMDDHSRNRRFGKSLVQPEEKVAGLVEGANAVKHIWRISQQQQLELPICQAVYQLVYQQKSVYEVVDSLLQRRRTEERLSC